jgi:uroporphyrinogen-III synthase
MAGEAFGVICGWFLNERLMRIVARDAGKPWIAVGSPTAALLKAIRLKAD